ncbi:MAG: fluoride efflux transporter CrcB [Chitinivibrionales bacterium]|nr:fluoride efflux transporter CrcB [Chitinivibrionales bacterium]
MRIAKTMFLIGCGGFIGAILRFSVASCFQVIGAKWKFPLGTYGVNVIGCLVFGLLAGLSVRHSYLTPTLRSLVFVGFLGSFTTYSTFSSDAVSLLQSQAASKALMYIALHILSGLGAVWAGEKIAMLAH